LPPEAAISGRSAGEIRKLKGFRDFIVGGNVIERAIAVVIGIAFNVVISALVKNLLTLLIAAIIGKPNVAGLTFTVNKSQFLDGDVINAAISFVLIAAVVYFAIVVPLNRMAARRAKPVEVTTRELRPEGLSRLTRPPGSAAA
jgi:large conductance mechanosensitive channel